MAEGNPEVMVKDVRPKIWQIILIGLIAIMFTSAWLLAYKYMNAAIWLNSYVETHPWTIPAGVIAFSVLVGLCRKYLHAPDVIHGGFTDSMTGDESHGADYRTFPGTLLSSFFSLFSGASVGPEGPLAFLVMEISAFVREKLKVLKEASFGFDVAALASAYNGIIGNPLFTAVFATEFNVGKKNALTFLAWNLLAGVIGFLFYYLLGLHSFASFLPFPPITSITPLYVIGAILLGILGAFIAILMGMAMKGVGSFMDRVLGDGIMTRILFGGIIIAGVCFFIPDLMFSGEETIAGIVENPAAFGILVLLVFAILKALLLALSFKSGFSRGANLSHTVYMHHDRACIKPCIPPVPGRSLCDVHRGCRDHPRPRRPADGDPPDHCGGYCEPVYHGPPRRVGSCFPHYRGWNTGNQGKKSRGEAGPGDRGVRVPFATLFSLHSRKDPKGPYSVPPGHSG